MPNQKQPNVRSGARPIAEILKQMILHGLEVLLNDCKDPEGYLVDELFSFYDSERISQIKSYILAHPSIPVVTNWPKDDLSIPQICVVTMAENEDPSKDWLANVGSVIGSGGRFRGQQGAPGTALEAAEPLTQREQRGYAETVNVTIFARAEDPDLCSYLANMVRLLCFMNQLNLIEFADFHNLTIDMADVAQNPELFPKFAYTRSVTLKGDTFFDYNLPTKVFAAFDFTLFIKQQHIGGTAPDAVTVPFDK